MYETRPEGHPYREGVEYFRKKFAQEGIKVGPGATTGKDEVGPITALTGPAGTIVVEDTLGLFGFPSIRSSVRPFV